MVTVDSYFNMDILNNYILSYNFSFKDKYNYLILISTMFHVKHCGFFD